MKKLLSVILCVAVILSCTLCIPVTGASAAVGAVTTATLQQSDLLNGLMEKYTSFVVVKHKQLGGSHYAYTNGVTDTYDANSPTGEEVNFAPGSQMVLVELEKSGSSVKKTETVLLESSSGVIRDPDVSEDGTKVLFSWKKEARTDDYHLYEYDLITGETKQLTFGLGAADTEPKYLPNGNIVFSSTRCVQTVDCWKTPVSNLYICGPNGEDIVRVGYDQVHTTYPTVTDDGRVLYTRWDYNDRNQMYVQALFQMFPDGTNQTEVFGNDSNFPTTLLHTRQIEGTTDKYISIASGHHTLQAGKLVTIDTSVGRNDADAVTLMFPDGQHSKAESVDGYGQNGTLYKYPYSVSEDTFLVSCAPGGWESNKSNTHFNIYIMNTKGEKVELVSGSNIPASQIVPVATRTLFERASMVNYGSDTGTYYIGNIYEGDGLKGIEVGAAKYLRVVALDYRAYAIGDTTASGWGSSNQYTPVSTGNGAWDVKRVLGVVPIEEDGSVLFTVPSETPIYFQVLDENGYAIQSMRSWSTLMPGETFSCVGCHEDKNTVPPASATTTMAMAKGVQELQPDLWQTGEGYENYDPYEDSKGFSYLEEIQPIFDQSCVECHNNLGDSYDAVNANSMAGSDTSDAADSGDETVDIFDKGSTWQYLKSSNSNAAPSNWNTVDFNGNWATGQAPFGDREGYKTSWTGGDTWIWIRKTFEITDAASFKTATAVLNTWFDDNPEYYLNGNLIYDPDDWVDAFTTVKLQGVGKYLVEGTNVLAIKIRNTTGGRQIDTSLSFIKSNLETRTIFTRQSDNWQYVIDNEPSGDWTSLDYNASSWQTGKGGFGDGGGANTLWRGETTDIWLRKEFSLSAANQAELSKMKLILDMYYDQNPVVYLNGEVIFSANDWNGGYKEYKLSLDYSKYLKAGKNVLAIHAQNRGGGLFIDTGLLAEEFSGTPFSLQSKLMGSNRMGRAFPISYLVLTGSTASGNCWVGRSSNAYTDWISSMSQCEMLEPYQYGAANSRLMEVLKKGHNGVKLTDAQLRKIAAWIDLAVPYAGSYDETNVWNTNAQRWADEFQNKRDYYTTLNSQARKARAMGGAVVAGDIDITFKSGNNTYSETYVDSGVVKLEVPAKYTAGNTLTVKLPEGEKYLGLALDSHMGEAIIYCPTGEYTFTVPSDLQPYPNNFKNMASHTITARIVGSDELNERHNLAKNPYDLTDLTGNMTVTGYPHATTDSNCRNDGQFIVRNAIDGFTANEGHGGFPVQSWGPDLGSHWMRVDFGREVYADEVKIYIRADFPHDTYFSSGTLQFSDGTKMDITFEKTSEGMSFTFDPIKTSYIELNNLKVVDVNGDDWAGITEFEVYGTEEEVIEDTCIWTQNAEKKIMSGMAVGTTIEAFKAGFSKPVKVYQNGREVTSGVVGTGMTVEYNGITYRTGIKGDLDGNGAVNVSDIMTLKGLIMNGKWNDLQFFVGKFGTGDNLTVSDMLSIKSIIMG